MTDPGIGPVTKRSSLIEVLGPAGAGKTTVIETLRRQDPSMREGVALSRSTKACALARVFTTFVPAYLARYPRTRWFSREELSRAVYLEGSHRTVGNRNGVVLLDHGPVFMLAMLRAFGPELVSTGHFARWSRSMVHQWATALDTILWLDAEDEMLIERIERRNRDHVVKGRPAAQARVFLRKCRTAFEEIVTELSASRAITVVRIDTATASPGEVAEWFRSSMDSSGRL